MVKFLIMCRGHLSDDRSTAIPIYSIFCTDSFTNGDRCSMKLAGVVTLYYPDDEVLGNMEFYLSALDVLYVMDRIIRKRRIHGGLCGLRSSFM